MGCLRAIFTFLFRLVLLAVVLAACTAAWILYDGLNDHGDRADVGLVLGTGLKHDGTPGPALRARLDRALELYRAGQFPLIVVSGASRSAEAYDEPEAMAHYLEGHGVPSEAVILDREGRDTISTARDLVPILQRRDLRSVMVVTHYYHITRAKLALRLVGIDQVSQAHAGVVQQGDLPLLGREVLALYYYAVKYLFVPLGEKLQTNLKHPPPHR